MHFNTFPPNGGSVSMYYDVLRQCLSVSSAVIGGSHDQVTMNKDLLGNNLKGKN